MSAAVVANDISPADAPSARAKPIATLLVANRGEIACRIITTARRLGIRTVAVFSDADGGSVHCQMADTALRIGGAQASESYLDIAAILAACRQSGANTVHPGYGFLAENALFSQACLDAGIIFVGPSPSAINALGNKVFAKQLARKIGVPVLPGIEPTDQSDAALLQAAQHIGYPLMIKAAAGGGGRGMRLVLAEQDFINQAQSARAEAIASFSSGQLLLERAALNARHIEVQILADHYGNVIHCLERDCSTQRRNQKIIEEAPAPSMPLAMRAAMGEAAIKLAKAVNYTGAGTVEFLVEDIASNNPLFWFLEVNTRLQVEHPVTEAITGIDLVEQQLLIAAGRPLSIAQDDIKINGHAIELRLCAEDADQGFIPQTGVLTSWPCAGELSATLGIPVKEFTRGIVRLDSGVGAGSQVTPYYDSMLAKLIVHTDNREAARQLAILALRQIRPVGVKTNRDSLLKLLQAAPFASAQLSTQWLETQSLSCAPPFSPNSIAASASSTEISPLTDSLLTDSTIAHSTVTASIITASPLAWHAVAAVLWVHASSLQHGPLQGFSSQAAACFVTSDGLTAQVRVKPLGNLRYSVASDDLFTNNTSLSREVICTLFNDKKSMRITGVQMAEQYRPIWHSPIIDETFYLDYQDCYAALSVSRFQARAPKHDALVASAMAIQSTLHGRVSRVLVSAGTQVKVGDCLLSIESMKMEHQILAQRAALISTITIAVGDQVTPQQILMTFAT